MSRVLIAWELGANLGHITPLRLLARGFREQGHQVLFAIRQYAKCRHLLEADGFPACPAPSAGPSPDAPADPVSYPEILLHRGFGEREHLLRLARGWWHLYREVEPELILFEHAPAALLAARGLGIERIHFGTGFTIPPRMQPLPSIRPWQPVPRERLAASELRVLDSVNAVCKGLSLPPLTALHELFQVEHESLATVPELDHYGPRPNGAYRGPLYEEKEEAAPFPDAPGRKIFVYVRAASVAFRPLLRALVPLGQPTLWFAPDLGEPAAKALEMPHLRFTTKPVSITGAARQADLAILHGGHGTAAAMYLHGVPIAVLPETVEHMLLGHRLLHAGAGRILRPDTDAATMSAAIEECLHLPHRVLRAVENRAHSDPHSPIQRRAEAGADWRGRRQQEG